MKQSARFGITVYLCVLMAIVSGAYAAEDRSFIAMNTAMTIHAPSVADEAVSRCENYAKALEALLSVTEASSEVARLNAGESVDLSAATYDILSQALWMCAETGGAIDITIYPVVRTWGFTTGKYRVPEQAEINDLLQYVDYRKVVLKEQQMCLPQNVMIDLGAIAKGYLTDQMVEILQEAGETSGLINLGGNIYCIGSKANGAAWRIGIRDPQGDSYFAVCSVRDSALVTSGGYERYFDAEGVRYSHIFDPASGIPVNNGILSVTVIGRNATQCDALSTALTVMGPDKAVRWLSGRDDCEAVILTDSTIYVTEGLKGCIEIYGNYTAYSLQWITR